MARRADTSFQVVPATPTPGAVLNPARPSTNHETVKAENQLWNIRRRASAEPCNHARHTHPDPSGVGDGAGVKKPTGRLERD
ncbi:hypothetical protein LMH87_004352 [Akanthomyces muscarius]|uniref:Uncharacterized protein n=1 Tax=Akanthomyces muscarius TaxID=2231603 RepID=A0A9W8Q3N4_AKAMU|nr:hypothetical protein LMH87_004352 [Akanthomyces muscarius]KAJ4145504.1 hypothetical protein LMH87_004352 [Akanthomyces muscarius]